MAGSAFRWVFMVSSSFSAILIAWLTNFRVKISLGFCVKPLCQNQICSMKVVVVVVVVSLKIQGHWKGAAPVSMFSSGVLKFDKLVFGSMLRGFSFSWFWLTGDSCIDVGREL